MIFQNVPTLADNCSAMVESVMLVQLQYYGYLYSSFSRSTFDILDFTFYGTQWFDFFVYQWNMLSVLTGIAGC